MPDRFSKACGSRHGTRQRCGLALLMICLLAGSSLSAQPQRWRWSNPRPHGANISDLALKSGIAVMAAEKGQLFTSEDLEVWYPRKLATTNHLRGITFLVDRLIVSGASGTIVWGDSFSDLHAIDLGTENWLENVAANDSLAVAVGDNGAIYSSANGTNWILEPSGFSHWLRGVAASTSTFVAVGEDGTIATRGNNGTWSLENSGTTAHLNRISYLGQEFIIVGNSGTLLTGNASGKNWSADTDLNITNHLYGLAANDEELIVVGASTFHLRNASGWQDQTTGASFAAPHWTYSGALWSDPLFVAGGRSGLLIEGIKTNSIYEWVDRYDSPRQWIWDLHQLTDFQIAVGDRSQILTSENGVRWNLELPPEGATNQVLLGIGGDTNGLVATGNGGTLLYSPSMPTNIVFTNIIAGSTNISTNVSDTLGIDWHAVGTPTTNDLMDAVYAQGTWIVVGGSGTILKSLDGENWILQSTPTSKFLSGVAASADRFVAVGDGGTILSSTDGESWTAHSSGVSDWLFRVIHNGNSFVAVGENGMIASSVDGISWIARSSGTDAWLTGIDFNGDTFYAAGTGGTLMVSTNLETWTGVPTPSGKSFYGVSASSRQINVVGIEGLILRGILQSSTNPVRFLSIGRSDAENVISIAGNVDQRLLIERSTNLVNWTESLELEFVDDSGSLLMVEPSATNAVHREFFRGRLLP
jgi:hypothetical protein